MGLVAPVINQILPQGRLTPTTVVPVPIAAALAGSTIYYTPYQGDKIPLWDGVKWVPRTFTELSNILANSATGSAGPAAVQTLGAYDLFVWDNAGVITLTRGPVWTYTASVTVTSAAPGVVTWTAHGLTTGMVVRFAGTAVPTGLSTATNYWITTVDANTFKVSSSMANLAAGTFITTSSTGTAVTSTCYGFSRGTGAGTTQLTLTNGILVNTVAITNGPGAGLGTYVGSIYTDGSGTAVSYDPGSTVSNGGAALLNIFNAYNRIMGHPYVKDTTSSYAYTTAARRPANGSLTNSISMMRGLQEDNVNSRYASLVNPLAVLNAFCITGIGLDTPIGGTNNLTGRFVGVQGRTQNEAALGGPQISVLATAGGEPGLGIHVLYAQEQGDGTNANLFNGGGLEADILW